MPTSGWVLTLPEDAATREEALHYIVRHPQLSVGRGDERKLAVVAQTDGPSQDESLIDALQGFDGLFVEVVFYDFSDVESFERVDRKQRRRSRTQATLPEWAAGKS